MEKSITKYKSMNGKIFYCGYVSGEEVSCKKSVIAVKKDLKKFKGKQPLKINIAKNPRGYT